eukprot:g15656.t1
MERVQGGREPPAAGWFPSASPVCAPDPPIGSKHGVDPRRTKPPVDANAAQTAAAAAAERFPSYIRRKSTAGAGGDGGGDDHERDTEKGYVGGDRVKLLVGSFNVGNSPLTDLAPWLPYGGKGFDLIVVGLQESTYRAPRAARDSPFQRSFSLSPTNSLSPIKGGRSSPRWSMMQSEDLDDTPPPGGGFPGSSSPPLPLSPAATGFSSHKRRGSSGWIGSGTVAGAGETGGDEQRRRRSASISSIDETGAALRFRLKSPRGRRCSSGGDRGQRVGGKERGEEEGGREIREATTAAAAAVSPSVGRDGGGDQGRSRSSSSTGGENSDAAARAVAVAAAAAAAAAATTTASTRGDGGRGAEGADEGNLETRSDAGDNKQAYAAAAAAAGMSPGHGGGRPGGGGDSEGSWGTAGSGASRKKALEEGKFALDMMSPPDSFTCTTPVPSEQEPRHITATAAATTTISKDAHNAPSTSTKTPTTTATLTAAAAATATAASTTERTSTRPTGGGEGGADGKPPSVASAPAQPPAPPGDGVADGSKRRSGSMSPGKGKVSPDSEKQRSRPFWGPESSRSLRRAFPQAAEAGTVSPPPVSAATATIATAAAAAAAAAGTDGAVEGVGISGEATAAAGAVASGSGVTTPDAPLPLRGISGASSLPREESRWELGSGPAFRRDSVTPTTTPTRLSMSMRSTTDPSGGHSNRAGAGGGGVNGTGKDLGRFGRARKAVKKRTKEMDAGAAHLRAKLSGHLGPDFEQVISLRRMQMRVKVFLRRSLLDVYDHEERESAAENTGIGKVVANKGGLVCKLRLRGTTLCFVSCHLQAHEGQNHLARRNSSCAEILQGARLGDRRFVDVDSQFHHVFWLGDMNYRINFGLGMQPEEQHARVTALVEASNWPSLWEADELLRELRAGRLLTGFRTEPPAFAPTFKGIRGATSGYSTKRIPSYTDRILWKSLPGHAPNLELLEFVSFPEITSSDHKPIHAAFSVKLTPEVCARSPEKKLFGRRARIPVSVLDVPRTATPPPRVLFEDLEAVGLPGIAGGGVRNPFVVFSSDPKHLVKSSSSGKPLFKTDVRKKTLNPKWTKTYGCPLAVSDPTLLRLSHISLLVMDKERKGELLGVANLSLAEVLWINTSRSAGYRRGSPSSAGAGADAPAAISSSFHRRRPSLPLRRRSLSPEGARRNSHAAGEGAREDRGRASTGAGDPGLAEGEVGRARAGAQRQIGLPRHRSHSSLPWGFFRPRSSSLSSGEGAGGPGSGGGGGGAGGGGGGGGEAATSLATVGKGDDLRRQQQRQQRSNGGGDNNASYEYDKQIAISAEGHAPVTSAASPGTIAEAAAAVVSPSTTPGSHVHREASTRSMGSTTTADSKERLRDSPSGGPSGGGGGAGYGRPSAFFQSFPGGHNRHGESNDVRAGPVFDLPLVKNGLPRGRIRGRCTLVLGATSGGNLLRMGSAGALKGGGTASVGGIGVAEACAFGGDRRDGGGGDTGGGWPSSSAGGRTAHGGGGRKSLARFFPGGGRGRSRSASNRSRSRSCSGSGSGSPVKSRGVVDCVATYPPRAAGGIGAGGGRRAGHMENGGRPRLSAKSKSGGGRSSSRRLGGGEERRDAHPSGSASIHEAADVSIGEGLVDDDRVRTTRSMALRSAGHLSTDRTSRLLVGPKDETVPLQTDTAAAVGLATISGIPAGTSRAPSEHFSSGNAVAENLRREVEGETWVETGNRPRLRRQQLQSSLKSEGINNVDTGNNSKMNNDELHQAASAEGDFSAVEGSGGGAGMVKFRLGGRVESFMAGGVMQEYLNQLVAESVAATENQTCNIAFVKTHKTASTTAATILYRYGKRHNLKVANFDGHQSSIELSEAAKQIQRSGEPVDVMHYHHAWDGFYEGRWDEAKDAYRKIMRDPSNIRLVTVMREPVSHYMSYYYYFLQPETGLSITEYMALSRTPEDPLYQTAFHGRADRKNVGIGWHGFKLLHNPLCAEFGIRTAQELDEFIQNDLPDFAMILLTEQFEEGLAIFMRMFNWRPIDMTYCRVIETKAGVARYDGKMLANVPKIRDLPQEVVAEIKRQTQLDQALYKAAVKMYLEKRALYEDHLEADVRRIRTVQSAVHGYLDFDATSPAHEWYEGDVHCFADPSPVQPF